MVDLLELRFDDRLRFPQLAPRKAGTGCHGDRWHKPEFYVSVRMLHVDMHPWLFAREEEQAIRAVANEVGAILGLLPNARLRASTQWRNCFHRFPARTSQPQLA
jgi:hypothetical protein